MYTLAPPQRLQSVCRVLSIGVSKHPEHMRSDSSLQVSLTFRIYNNFNVWLECKVLWVSVCVCVRACACVYLWLSQHCASWGRIQRDGKQTLEGIKGFPTNALFFKVDIYRIGTQPPPPYTEHTLKAVQAAP